MFFFFLHRQRFRHQMKKWMKYWSLQTIEPQNISFFPFVDQRQKGQSNDGWCKMKIFIFIDLSFHFVSSSRLHSSMKNHFLFLIDFILQRWLTNPFIKRIFHRELKIFFVMKEKPFYAMIVEGFHRWKCKNYSPISIHPLRSSHHKNPIDTKFVAIKMKIRVEIDRWRRKWIHRKVRRKFVDRKLSILIVEDVNKTMERARKVLFREKRIDDENDEKASSSLTQLFSLVHHFFHSIVDHFHLLNSHFIRKMREPSNRRDNRCTLK